MALPRCVDADRFRIEAGQDVLQWYGSSAAAERLSGAVLAVPAALWLAAEVFQRHGARAARKASHRTA